MNIDLPLCKQMIDNKKTLFMFGKNTWNHLIECKKISSGSFKNIVCKMCLQFILFNIYV